MQTEVRHGSVKGLSDLRKAHASPASNDIQRRPYFPAKAKDGDGDGAAFARHEPSVGSAPTAIPPQQPPPQPQRPPAGTGTPATTNGMTAPAGGAAAGVGVGADDSSGLTTVEGTGCTYVLRDEIGRGAYGKVYLADVIHTDPMQSPQPVPPPPSSTQLPSLWRSTGGGLVEKAIKNTTISTTNTNGSSSGASNGHRDSCSSSGTNTAGQMVLKRMENVSVEDGLQAATLREFMVLDEISMGSFDREHAEVEAFRAGRVVFRTSSTTSAAARPHEGSACSFLGNSNTVNTNGRWDDEVLATSTSRNDDYDYLSSPLRRRINRGRSYLIGMRDTIMRPQEQLAYVALDYCDGGDLWHFIHDLKVTLKTSDRQFGDAMPTKVFRRWAVELILGLAFLHSRNISHRDLKPQNLMLARRTDIPVVPAPRPALDSGREDEDEGEGKSQLPPGEQYNLKVGDFGLSRLEDIPYKKYLHEAVTLWYRSPDVLLGNTNYHFSADAWSLGCILVEMASGSVLFKGRDEADELRHIFTRGCRPSLFNFPRLTEYPYAERFAEVLQKYRDVDGEAKATADGVDAEAALQAHVEKLARHLRAFLKERNAQNLLGTTGIDLVARLLVFDPERRFTVLQVVRHRFFQEAYAEVYGPD